tara:strand:- start:559 stop:1581 length:1023 start_codon:yes stop_codon:yes gene_type:complete
VFSLSSDIAYQFATGSDFFGIKGYEECDTSKTVINCPAGTYRLAGFLKDEYIAGSYIQKFFIFSLVLFPFLSKRLEKQKFIISIFLMVIFFAGVLYSGNRMPFVMFVFSIFLMMIFIKDLRFPLAVGFLFCSIMFYSSYKKSEQIQRPYFSFYVNAQSILKNLERYAFKEYPELENKKYKNFSSEYHSGEDSKKLKDEYIMINFGSGHAVIYLTAINSWKNSPIIGSGIKSFRVKCLDTLHVPNRVCESHPHNYYLELLNDTGLIGTLIFFFALFFLLKEKYLNFKRYEKKEKFLIICIFIIIFCEFFPLRSTGSFFATQSSAYVFFLLGMLNGIKKIKI